MQNVDVAKEREDTRNAYKDVEVHILLIQIEILKCWMYGSSIREYSEASDGQTSLLHSNDLNARILR